MAAIREKVLTAANALISLLTQLDADGEERLSGYDRERVCVPQVCDCHRGTCRYLAFLNECEVKRYPFQICNHNLLLTDAIHRSSGRRSLLPAGCAVVIGEAHKLPEAARQMFGMTLGAEDVKGLIADLGAERLKAAASVLQRASEPLIASLEKPCGNREFSTYARQLVRLGRVLSAVKKTTADQVTPQTRRKLKDLSRTIEYLTDESEQIIRYVTETAEGQAILFGTVADLSAKLEETMWARISPYILTSGTMAVGNSFRRFREEAGLSDHYRVKESVSRSPFDYQKNRLLYLSKKPIHMGNPNYFGKLTADIAALLQASNGHAMILFTSYAALAAVKERLLRRKLPWSIFALNRNAVYTVEQFKRTPGAVLLATGAAWEGFDFPGDTVSMLIIPRPKDERTARREDYE